MTISETERLGLTKWNDGAVDGPTRAQFNDDHDELDELAAITLQDDLADFQAFSPGIHGRYFWTTDTKELFRDDGTDWYQIPTYAAAGVFTNAQKISTNVQPQLNVESATSATSSQQRWRKRNTDDGSTWSESLLDVSNNVAILHIRKNSTSSMNANLSGMEGRWAINHGTSAAPANTLVINARGGSEIARFTESGFVGIGNAAPVFPLDVRSPATQTPVARFGGPVANGQDYALTMTPMGVARMRFGFGAETTGSTTTARHVDTGMLDVTAGYFQWYANYGVTIGGTFTPTLRFYIDPTGATFSSDLRLGAIDGTGQKLRAFAVDANEFLLTSSRGGGGSSILVLEAQGNSAAVHVKPETQKTASFYRQADGTLVSANLGYTVLGSEFPAAVETNGYPGVRVVRVQSTTDGAGNVNQLHGLGNLGGKVLMCQIWAARNSDGAPIEIPGVQVTGDRIIAGTNNAAVNAHCVITLMISSTAAIW